MLILALLKKIIVNFIDNTSVIINSVYFPPISYFGGIACKSNVLIEAEENYSKQSYRNRMEILGPNGLQILSFPIAKGENIKQKTRDVKISYDTNWQKIHWKSIETAYNSSPFFLYYQDDFIRFFENKYVFLLDMNHEILLKCLDLLKINLSVDFTQSYEKVTDMMDLRMVYNSKRILLEKKLPQYIQVFSERFGFVQNLSILDLLFNLGPEAKQYLLNLNLCLNENVDE